MAGIGPVMIYIVQCFFEINEHLICKSLRRSIPLYQSSVFVGKAQKPVWPNEK